MLTPMSQWVRERELYELFRQIPFFHQYILRRAFSFWKTVCPRALTEHDIRLVTGSHMHTCHCPCSWCGELLDTAAMVLKVLQLSTRMCPADDKACPL